MPRPVRLLVVCAPLVLLALLAGCDLLGIEPASALAAKREAEGKAIGGACRHAGRAIEDCYVLNKKAEKASVFAGWREMNDYMAENKLDVVRPELPASAPVTAQPADAGDDADAEKEGAAKPAKVAKNTKH